MIASRGASEVDETQKEGSVAGARIPLVTEIMSYLGGILAVAGVGALLGLFWNQLGAVGQVGLTAATAAACLTGGVLIGRIDDPGAHRLQEFLLFIGVAVAGAAIGIAAFRVAETIVETPNPAFNMNPKPGANEWAMLFGFLGAAVVGSVVYWRYRFVLQQIAVAIGVFVFPMFAIQLAVQDFRVSDWANSILWVALGIGWGLAGLRRLLAPGESTALAISGAGILMGLFALASYSPNYAAERQPTWPLWLALGGALLLLLAGVALKKIIFTGFGSVGAMVFVTMLLAERFQDSIILPVAIIMLGVVLMAIAAFVAVRRQRKLAAATPEMAPEPVEPAGLAKPPRPPRRVPVVSEILGYVGGAFALGGGLALITAFADDVGVFGQIAVCAVAAIAGLLGGFMIGRIDDRGAKRLEQFLLAVGVAGSGAAAGLAAYRLVLSGILGVCGILAVSTAGDWGLFIGSAVAAVVGGVVWWFRRTWLQELAFGVSVALACVSVLAIPQTEGPDWVVGAVLVVLGAVWGGLGYRGAIKPVNAALALGSLGVIAGFLAMAGMGPYAPYVWALWSGLAAAIVLLGLGLLTKKYVVVGIAALGMWQFLQGILSKVFPNSIAGPIVVMVLGVLFVGGGVAVAMRAQHKRAGQGLAAQ
jgi:hypothetical protein